MLLLVGLMVCWMVCGKKCGHFFTRAYCAPAHVFFNSPEGQLRDGRAAERIKTKANSSRLKLERAELDNIVVPKYWYSPYTGFGL